MKVLRATTSVCPTCLQDVPASVVEDGGAVLLRKTCPEHGGSECLLSRHPWYWEALDRYFFAALRKPPAQRDYLVRMTERCNLQCPICLASATPVHRPPVTPDMTVPRLRHFLAGHRDGSLKIDLISAEPTLCEDLPDILREIRAHGHIASLHTNGIRLADRAYLRSLVEAGLDEVFLQMDGFDDDAYMRIRGARLTRNKLQVLENLEAEGVATSLVSVIMPGCNETEIPKILEYAREKSFIREVMFLGTRALGAFREAKDLLMPDEVVDMVDAATEGIASRHEVFCFNKLYFALLGLLGVRKCLYVQHYLLVRGPREFHPLGDLVDWARVEPILDEFPTARSRWLWFLRLALAMLQPRALAYLPDFLAMLLRLKFGWKLRKLPRRLLLLGYITACDPLNVDEAVSRYCGKGELARDLGVHESGADANIARERLWAAARERGEGRPAPG